MSSSPAKPVYHVDNSFHGHDPRVIDYDDTAERAFWMKYFEATAEELHEALVAAGNSAQAVKDYFGAKRRWPA